MTAYTIEDIELIRRKSGISYQEAVALLDYHNGNVARALVDLERNGRIKPESYSDARSAGSARNAQSGTAAQPGKPNAVIQALTWAYRARIKVNRDATPILNVSVLFSVLSLVIAPYLVIIAAVVCLLLGYKFTFSKNDKDFAGANMEKMVRNAAENVKASVNDFAKGFQNAADEPKAESPNADEPAKRSFYTDRPASSAHQATPVYRPSYPTMNVPVQVESQDGSVTLESESDGYSSATVE